MTSAYADAIVEATGCSTEDAPVVEELMRVETPTLDHLDRRAFNRLARIGVEMMRQLAEDDPECLDFYRRTAIR